MTPAKPRRPGINGQPDTAELRPPVDPYQKALEFLVRREHSRHELKRKLADRGAEPGRSEQALDRLVAVGYQDDGRFAASLARTRACAGYGPQRIRAELATHALTAEQIAMALEACETDWPSKARELVARRYRGAKLCDPKQRRKAIEFLLRRGFDHASAFGAVGGSRASPELRASEDDSTEPD